MLSLKNYLKNINIPSDLMASLITEDLELEKIAKEYIDYKSKFGYYDANKIQEQVDYFLDGIRRDLKNRNNISLCDEEYADGNDIYNLMSKEDFEKLLEFLKDFSSNLTFELKDLKSNEFKEKIKLELENDLDLLNYTLRVDLLDYEKFDDITVFETNEYEEHPSYYFDEYLENTFDSKRTEKYFIYNKNNKTITYYNDLKIALSDALNKLDEIAEYIEELFLRNYPKYPYMDILSYILD